MNKVLDFTEYVKKIEKKAVSCTNCMFTEKHNTFDFYICNQALSPRIGEIVDKKMNCECFSRRMKS